MAKDTPITTCYAVLVLSQNSWHSDGSPIIERSCGHCHRTETAARECIAHLCKPYADGSTPASWYHAKVQPVDRQGRLIR